MNLYRTFTTGVETEVRWHGTRAEAHGEAKPLQPREDVRIELVDREGSPVRPVFVTDEHDFTHCSDCGAEL